MFNFIVAIAVVTSTILVQVSNTEVVPEYQMTAQEQIIHAEMALKNTNRYNVEEVK